MAVMTQGSSWGWSRLQLQRATKVVLFSITAQQHILVIVINFLSLLPQSTGTHSIFEPHQSKEQSANRWMCYIVKVIQWIRISRRVCDFAEKLLKLEVNPVSLSRGSLRQIADSRFHSERKSCREYWMQGCGFKPLVRLLREFFRAQKASWLHIFILRTDLQRPGLHQQGE